MDLYCDWNSDLILTANGGLQAAVGWDQVRQRIIRRMITNAAVTLPTGISTPADYVFAPDFGFGLGALVSGNYTPGFLNTLKNKISQAVFEDADIDSSVPPSVVFQRSGQNTLWIIIGVTLITGQPGTISLQVT